MLGIAIVRISIAGNECLARIGEIGAQVDLDFKSTIFALEPGSQELDVLRGVCVVGLAEVVAADAVLDFRVANNL